MYDNKSNLQKKINKKKLLMNKADQDLWCF